MIADATFLKPTKTTPQQKENAAQNLLHLLRNGSWVNRHHRKNDLATLFPILVEALGLRKEIHELCSALPWHDTSTKEGKALNLTELLNALAHLGFVAHAVEMQLKNLDLRLCPCLFISDMEEHENVMVILGFNEDTREYDVFNARTQAYETMTAKDTPTGTSWIFVPEDDVQDALSSNMREASGYSWFRALMERFAGGLWHIIAIGAMLTFLSLAAPLFVMIVYDRVIGGHAPEALGPLLAGALLALGIEGALRLVRAHVLSWYGARLDYIVGSQIFERLLHMPVLFTERASVAAQIARIKSFDAVRAFFTGPAFLALAELPFTLVLIVVIVIIAGPLAFVPIIAAAFYALLIFLMHSSMRTAMRLSSIAGAAKQEMTIETFEKMDGLRAGGLTSIWFKDFRDLSGKASLASFHSGFLASILETLSHGIYLLAGLSIAVLGVVHIWAGGMSAGALIAVMILTWRILGPMQILTNSLPRFEQLSNAIGQINRLMTIETENTGTRITARLESPQGELDFQKVGLRYTRDNDPVFVGLSFIAKPGELIAITGGNGSGKSTVLKLINGLYHPQAGSIHIDGIDIRQLEPQHLRRHIAYVPQNPSVFHGSIADNLRFANPLATDKKIREILKQVDLWHYVDSLPHGMHTIISTHGETQLPTGLCYNLNLARAYIKDTPIILIDEMPSAFLNSESGQFFKNILKEWKGQKTIVMVTHREDYLMLSNRAILLRSGQSALVDTPENIIRTIYDSQGGDYV
ncbi:MAG: hypothetical protein COA45_08055 [Zetaproteobacteria bacterium]|nr:MAG: hypothetical protein COA45_08055 [Zetaproteobacteria bacterium]